MFKEKPRGLLRILFRVPIYVYRFDLGRLFGYRFLMLTHRGRRTGLLRETVLEVVRYDPRTRESIVIAALGERADWYRNIQSSPPLEVQTGRLRYVPEYRFLSAEEAYEVWSAFERAHPFEARLAGIILGWDYDRTESGRRDLARTIRLVAFRPS